MSESKYRCAKGSFFQPYFEKALGYQEYLETGSPKQKEDWLAAQGRVPLGQNKSVAVGSWKRTMNVLVMSGIWCGDCVRQVPMIENISRASSVMNVRYLDNRENPELQEELRINGAEKVPVVVTLSEDFFEIGRFGDRHLSVYRRKAATEMGAACAVGFVPPPEDALKEELSEWLDYFERQQILLQLSPLLRERYGD